MFFLVFQHEKWSSLACTLKKYKQNSSVHGYAQAAQALPLYHTNKCGFELLGFVWDFLQDIHGSS